jgi:hypothetical protein
MEELEIKLEQDYIRASIRNSRAYIQDQENQYKPPEFK